MVDVFISSAQEDRDKAESLAKALMANQCTVSWDHNILGHEPADIERELTLAKRVIVIWSRQSVSSDRIKREAARAAREGILVPVLVENVELPPQFKIMRTIDLTGWSGDPSAPEFADVRRVTIPLGELSGSIEAGSIEAGSIEAEAEPRPRESPVVRYVAGLATALGLPVVLVNVFLGVLERPAAAIPLSLAAFLLSVAGVLFYAGFAKERSGRGFYASSTATSRHYPVYYRYNRWVRLLSLSGAFLSIAFAIGLLVSAPISQNPGLGEEAPNPGPQPDGTAIAGPRG